MKVYKAKKSGFFQFVFIGILILPILLFLLDMAYFLEKPWGLLPLLFPILLILWIYFDTSYGLVKGDFIFKSAFLKGKIPVKSIHEIIQGKTMYVGIKPAMAQRGLIIKYNKYDEVYIASENDDEIIKDFLEINGNIKITQHKKH